VHLVDVSGASARDPVDDLNTVRTELELFQPALAAKPQLVAANKMDAVDDQARVTRLQARAAELGLEFLTISGATGEGIPTLLEAMWTHLAGAPRDQDDAQALPTRARR
jgi:GTP-binding protein